MEEQCKCWHIKLVSENKPDWAWICYCNQCKSYNKKDYTRRLRFNKKESSITNLDELVIKDSGLANRWYCPKCSTSVSFDYKDCIENEERKSKIYINWDMFKDLSGIDFDEIYKD